MTAPRRYPDQPAGPFPAPPVTFVDREGREIEVRADGDAREALVAMYVAFDPADRAQGIPPAHERRIRDWLDTILGEGLNVVAWHGDRAVGHATLMPGADDAFELAIFVHQEYQRAGVGSELIETLLGHGEENGVECVWLTVERWNNAAVGLYRKVGFETSSAESFELEMGLRLSK